MSLVHEYRRHKYDAKHGEGASQYISNGPKRGSLVDLANELGFTKQYMSQLYYRLTGRKWREVRHELKNKSL